MSERNIFSDPNSLKNKLGATVAVLDMLTKACTSGAMTGGWHSLEWAARDNNLKELRDKIIESATED